MKVQATTSKKEQVDVVVRLAYPEKKPGPARITEQIGDISIDNAGGKSSKTSVHIAVSVGPRDKCNQESIRRAAGAAARWLSGHAVQKALIDAGDIVGSADKIARAVAEGLHLGSFRFDQHKARNGKVTVPTCFLRAPGGEKLPASVLKESADLTDAVNLARSWGHEPPNIINPVTLADRVTRLARKHRLRCRVFDDKQLRRMKANAIVQVGIGSGTPSRLIVLEHGFSAQNKNVRPIVLVGKAITFDTGGYSLKDKVGIVGMKYDKCGGMAVIGALQAAAALKLKQPVVGVIAAAENMISEKAYRPNDIVTTLSGKTVEIISTDAEGRMVLADALTWTQRNYKPKAIIDLATLTGGVVVALGGVRAGIMANNDQLAGNLISAGEKVHERLWRLPLDDDYFDLIKGDDSDLKNSGGRGAHAIIGGLFLKQFVDNKVPWAHLDIAGLAQTDSDQPYCPKGATGFGVRLLIEYLQNL